MPSALTTWEHAVKRARALSPGVGAEAGGLGPRGCAWHRLLDVCADKRTKDAGSARWQEGSQEVS